MACFRTVTILLALCCGLLVVHFSCGYQWVATNIPSSTWPDVAISSNGLFVAAVSNIGGIWLSYDGGRNWTNSGAPIGPWSAVSMSKTGENMAAVQNPGNIYLSRNNGTSWAQPASDNIAGPWVDVACSSTCDIMVAAMTQVGVFVSKNQGNNWVHSIVSNSIMWVSVASDSAGQHLAACASSGEVAVSNSSGASWFFPTVSTVFNPVTWSFVTIDVSGQYYYLGSMGFNMFVSTDNGTTWTQSSLSTVAGEVNSIGVSEDRQKIFVLNDWAGAYSYFSYDYGTTWTQPIDTYQDSTRLAMSATGATSAISSENGGVFMCYGFGSGVVTPTIFSFLEFAGFAASETGQVVVGAAQSSLWISTDYGQGWNPIQDLPMQGWSAAVVMNGTGGFIAAVNGEFLFRSFDTAVTWTQIGLPFYEAADIACDSTGAKMVAIRTGVGIYLSDDYGATWTQSSALDEGWIEVTCDDTRTNIYVAAWGGMIYASNDGGLTWYVSFPTMGAWLSLSTSGNGQIVAAGSYDGLSIVVSQDAGKTWLLSNASTSNAYTYNSLSADYSGRKWIASGASSLFQSDNYGLNWTVTGYFPDEFNQFEAVAMSGDGSLSIASTYSIGVYVTAPSPSSAPHTAPSAAPTKIPTHHPSTSQPSFVQTQAPTTNATAQAQSLSLPASLSSLNHAYTSVLCVFFLALLAAVMTAIIWCVKNRNVSGKAMDMLFLASLEAGMWTATLVSQLLFVIVALSTSGSNPRGLLALGICWVALRVVGTVGNALLIQALCPPNGWWSSGLTGGQAVLLVASLWQSAVSRHTELMQDVSQVTRTLHWDLMVCTVLLVVKITFAASLNDDGQNDDDTAITTGYRTAGRATAALAVLCSLWQWLFLLGVRGYYHYHPVLKYGRDIESDASAGGMANAIQF